MADRDGCPRSWIVPERDNNRTRAEPVIRNGETQNGGSARARSPLPHAEHGLLRQWMADLPRQHGDLATVMGIVRNQITDKSSHIWTEILYATVSRERVADHRAHSRAAFLQCPQSLGRSTGRAVPLLRDFTVFGRLELHHTYVMHVSHDGRSRSPLAVWRFRIPRASGKALDQVGVNLIVRVECIKQRGRKLAGVGLLNARIFRFGAFSHSSLANHLASASIWHKLAAICKGGFPPGNFFSDCFGARIEIRLRRIPDENSGAGIVRSTARLGRSGARSCFARQDPSGHSSDGVGQFPSPCFHSQSTDATVLCLRPTLHLC